MKNYKLFVAVALLAGSAFVASPANATPSAQKFVTQASIANQFEIESSKLALQNSQNNDVKTFAQHMIDDHTKAADGLTNALQSSDSKATPATAFDNSHLKQLEKLKALNGSDFDKKYVSLQVDAHKDAVSLFSAYSKGGKDDSLKNFATQTLPTLQQHLQMVKQLNSAM